MRHPLRAFVLGCALAATPACASFPFGNAQIENPISAAQGADRQAYAALQTYAVLIEEAADIVRDPEAPAALKRALAQAERVATPAAETLGLAVHAYAAARADLAATPNDDSAVSRFAIAARHLGEALETALGPLGELEALVRAQQN